MTIQTDITIIGAGLTGLTIGYHLQKSGVDFRIVEARGRLGGRILTSHKDGYAHIEKGATWFGDQHTALLELLNTLSIQAFPQALGKTAIYEPLSTSPPQLVQLPPNDAPSYRIKGGTSVLIKKLASYIPNGWIHMNQAVSSIDDTGELLEVTTENTVLRSRYVISTLPPNLFVSLINVTPSLPESLVELAQTTHTWMGESIKVGLRFEKPFWEEKKQLSATVFSNVGPITEMYDHTNNERTAFALKGFLNSAYSTVSRRRRKEVALSQLRKYYGNAIDQYESYEELVWQAEQYTYAQYPESLLPHQNNGHPSYRSDYLDGKLYLTGSETAAHFPGYMEGAIRSALWVISKVVN